MCYVHVLHQDWMENGEMVITKRLRFMHILFTICLVIILIAGTGIASAAVGLRAPIIRNNSKHSDVHPLNHS
jgi:hypothetical protein